MNRRTTRIAVAALAALAAPAHAGTVEPVTVCVDVQLAGEPQSQWPARLACLSRSLAEGAAQQQERQLLIDSVVRNSTASEPTELGLYNQTATRFRMGGSFGKSVYPQRPVRSFAEPWRH